eukprot:s443_g37.t1
MFKAKEVTVKLIKTKVLPVGTHSNGERIAWDSVDTETWMSFWDLAAARSMKLKAPFRWPGGVRSLSIFVSGSDPTPFDMNSHS